MKTTCIQTIEPLLEALTHQFAEDDTVALVPTMGNLHEGHMALVQAAKSRASKVVVSIFVNPAQFGPNEDFNAYPRTLEKDLALCEAHGVDLVFAPTAQEIYPFGQGQMVSVNEETLSAHLCGANRPGHFRGVLTVVMKLINLIQPDYAVFGEKDYQQLAVIHKMVQDLFMPVDLLAVPIVREEDGLAMSSRNQYLDVEDRKKAPLLYDVLQEAREQLNTEKVADVKQKAVLRLEKHGFQVDYFEVCHSSTLEALTDARDEMVILAAAKLGKTRLIDNLLCMEDEDTV